MKIKQFRSKLARIIEESGEFVTWDNRDKNFSHLEDDEMAIIGESEAETFAIHIIKVEQ